MDGLLEEKKQFYPYLLKGKPILEPMLSLTVCLPHKPYAQRQLTIKRNPNPSNKPTTFLWISVTAIIAWEKENETTDKVFEDLAQ